MGRYWLVRMFLGLSIFNLLADAGRVWKFVSRFCESWADDCRYFFVIYRYLRVWLYV